jgi:hypothetical protein
MFMAVKNARRRAPFMTTLPTRSFNVSISVSTSLWRRQGPGAFTSQSVNTRKLLLREKSVGRLLGENCDVLITIGIVRRLLDLDLVEIEVELAFRQGIGLDENLLEHGLVADDTALAVAHAPLRPRR